MGALEATMETLQGENHRSCASPGFPPAPPFQGTLENKGHTSYKICVKCRVVGVSWWNKGAYVIQDVREMPDSGASW